MASTKPPEAVDSRRTSTKANTLLAKSARGASLLITLQVASRGLTFAVNQILLRFLSPQLLAISTQLEVYSITVLLFARESLRIALQRQSNSEENVPETGEEEEEAADKAQQLASKNHVDSRCSAGRSQAVVNLSYISIVLGIVFAVAGAWIWTPDPRVLMTPYFRQALLMYGVATFLELLAEPCFVVVQQNHEFGIRARAESSATFLRCIITCFAAAWAAHMGKDIGILPFAIGQWTYAITLPVVYYSKTYGISSSGGFSLLAKPIQSIHKSEFILNYFSRPLLWLGCSLFAQSVIKHFLTQGDTLLISYLANLETQGQFALVSNYGGLIARLIFQPIEESSRSYFAKVLSSTTTGTSRGSQNSGKTSKGENKREKESPPPASNQPSKEAIKTASTHLHTLLHFYTLLNLLATILGPTLAPPLLTLIAGRRWTSTAAATTTTTTTTTQILSTYTYYIPLLSINGLLEAFITSIATPTTLTLQTIFMTSFSLLYIVLAYILLGIYGLGAKGLIWANMVNMGVRIVWSSWFIGGYLRGCGERLDWGRVVPGKVVLAVAVGSASVLWGREEIRLGVLGDVVGFLRRGQVTEELVELVKVAVVMGTFVVVL